MHQMRSFSTAQCTEGAIRIVKLAGHTTDQEMLEACYLALQRAQILEEDKTVYFVSSPYFCFMGKAKELHPTNLSSYQAASRTKSQRLPISGI